VDGGAGNPRRADAVKNKGLAIPRLMMGVTAVFILIIIFTYFDPVIEDKLYQQGVDMTDDGSQARNVLDKYLMSWHYWVPMFLVAFFILIVSSGAEPDRRYTQ